MFVPNEDSPRDFKELMEDEFGVETQVEKEEVKKLIDTSNFKPITCDELTKILGLTIKRDETNKILPVSDRWKIEGTEGGRIPMPKPQVISSIVLESKGDRLSKIEINLA